MSSRAAAGLGGMSDTQQATTTVTNLGVAMFTVADVDASIRFYTEKLGYELRADVAFGPTGEDRWVEVAPPGSIARLALNGPREGATPGGGAIGVETRDAQAEYDRLVALGDIKLDSAPTNDIPGAPVLFMMRDPDDNHIAVVEVPADA